MPEENLPTAQILTMLAEMPPRIAALTAGLRPELLQAAPGAGEWSLNDVLAHLRSCADVWGRCMVTIITQDRPTIRAISPRTWVHRTDYPEQNFQPSLQAYTTQRADLLAVLQPLAPEAWARSATVTGAGRVLERSVLNFAQRLAIHEREHSRQFGRVANALRMEQPPSA